MAAAYERPGGLASGSPLVLSGKPMTAQSDSRDPLSWCLLIAAAFLALCWHRLGVPSQIYFDEVHYVKAARSLLELKRANPEHPMVGKEAIAASIRFLGDSSLHWRIPSALCGAIGLFAFGRLMWLTSRRRFATTAAMILVATNFSWFIQSRIAMLDMVMAGLGMVALWQFAAALNRPAAHARLHLAICGLCIGLALGAKWSFAPLAILPGLLWLAMALRGGACQALFARDRGPVRGISLAEAALWLGLLPVAVYWASFAPAFFLSDHPVDPWKPIAHHQYMLQLQDSVRKPHPYRSIWWQWIVNWRAVWYLYEHVDGAQRGIVLIGNPLTMLAGLPAVCWAIWAGWRRRRMDALAFAVMYVASLGLWIVTAKPIQFYYHYLLPAAFLMGCLALALDAIWQTDRRTGREVRRWFAPGAIALSCALFVYFYPIISAAKLQHGKQSFAEWMWLRSWR